MPQWPRRYACLVQCAVNRYFKRLCIRIGHYGAIQMLYYYYYYYYYVAFLTIRYNLTRNFMYN